MCCEIGVAWLASRDSADWRSEWPSPTFTFHCDSLRVCWNTGKGKGRTQKCEWRNTLYNAREEKRNQNNCSTGSGKKLLTLRIALESLKSGLLIALKITQRLDSTNNRNTVWGNLIYIKVIDLRTDLLGNWIYKDEYFTYLLCQTNVTQFLVKIYVLCPICFLNMQVAENMQNST